jgi:hypothetical protein
MTHDQDNKTQPEAQAGRESRLLRRSDPPRESTLQALDQELMAGITRPFTYVRISWNRDKGTRFVSGACEGPDPVPLDRGFGHDALQGWEPRIYRRDGDSWTLVAVCS